MPGDTDMDRAKARVLVEKKTVINLLEAFAVAVKHYLRGEDGIYYQDLYHLVKFLPAYALPLAIPSKVDLTNGDGDGDGAKIQLPMPAASGAKSVPTSPTSPRVARSEKVTDPSSGEEKWLSPAKMPPKFSFFDIFPFSLLVRALTKKGKDVGGTKASRLRARTRGHASHNVPLAISLYLVCQLSFLMPLFGDSPLPGRART
jgi:ion channel-forming bestrophin family protein